MRTPAFSRVLYVTNQANDRWFVPTTGYGDNPNAGTTAQQLAQCEVMVSERPDDPTDIGVAVQPNVLMPWVE